MNILLLALVSAALVGIQLLAGGRTFALSLPSYGVLAVAACLSWWHARRVPISHRTALNLAVSAIFFGYILIRALSSPDHYLARTDLYLVLAALVLYLLVALNITSPKLRVAFVGVLLLLAAADCVIGIFQFGRGDNFMPFAFLPRANAGARASGFFGCPNHLAGFLEVAVLMGLGVTCWSEWRPWAKILTGYASLLCFLGLALSGSRGGYVSVAAGLLAFVCLSLLVLRKQEKRRFAVVLCVIAASFLALGGGLKCLVDQNSALSTRVANVFEFQDCRPRLWRAALEQFQLNPIFGTGSGTYLYYGRQFRDPSVQTDPEYAHNDYLQLLAEYGIVGAAGFLLFFAIHLWSGWTCFTNMIFRPVHGAEPVLNHSRALTIGALSSAVAYAAHSVVDFNLHIPANTLLLAFVFGVLAHRRGTLAVGSKGWGDDAHPLSPHLRLAIPLLGLCLALVALPKLPAEYCVDRAKALLSDSRSLESPEAALAVAQLAHRGLAWDTGNTELYYCLGEAHFTLAGLSTVPAEKERHYQESIAADRKAAELAPLDVRFLLCELTSLDALERFREGDLVLDRAVKLDPNSVFVRFACARHLHTEKKISEAEAAYRKAAEVGSAGAAYWLQRIAEDRKGEQATMMPLGAQVEYSDVSKNP